MSGGGAASVGQGVLGGVEVWTLRRRWRRRGRWGQDGWRIEGQGLCRWLVARGAPLTVVPLTVTVVLLSCPPQVVGRRP